MARSVDYETMPDEELEQAIEQAQAVLAQRLQTRIEQLRRLDPAGPEKRRL